MAQSSTTIKQAGKYACLLLDETFKAIIVKPQQEKLVRGIIELLTGKHLSSITFPNKEQHGLVVSEKNVTFDLLCRDEDTKEEFIVELQYSGHPSYRDRMLSYATYPIREQLTEKLAQRLEQDEQMDKMDYSLRPVYVIGLINFKLPHDSDNALDDSGLISRYAIRNDLNGELMTEALHFVYLEMDRLPYKADEAHKCQTLLEKFVFSMKYIHLLKARPLTFEEDLLHLLYRATELGSMTVSEREEYDQIMRTELDRIVELRAAREEGIASGVEQGRAEGKIQMAANLLKMGYAVPDIAKASGLDEEEIRRLQ